MKVLLKSCGNPDYHQDPNKPISPTMFVRISNAKEASNICRKYIEDNDLGYGNWTGGEIWKNKKVIAKVSYNGRVWKSLPNGESITLY